MEYQVLEVPDGTESIGEKAYLNNKNLISVSLPPSVTEVAPNAFEGCDEIRDFKYFGRIEEAVFEDVKASGCDLMDGRTLVDPCILGKSALRIIEGIIGRDQLYSFNIHSDVGILYNTSQKVHPDRRIIRFKGTEEGETLKEAARDTDLYLRRDISIKIRNGFDPFWIQREMIKDDDDTLAMAKLNKSEVALVFINHKDRKMIDGKMCISIQITKGVYFFNYPIRVVIDEGEFFVGTHVFLNDDSARPYICGNKVIGVFDSKGCKQSGYTEEKVIDKYKFITQFL